MINFPDSDDSDFSDKPKQLVITKPILPQDIDSDIVVNRESDGHFVDKKDSEKIIAE